MVQLSPDTRTSGWDACGGYYDADPEIWGFSHTHLSGTGIGDYGDVLMMPFMGEVGIGSGTPEKPDYAYRSAFNKTNQFATPGYYRVLLDRYQIKAELSATPRAGIHRYTFPKAAKAGVVVDLKHSIQNRQTLQAEIEVINDHEIAGWRHVRGWAQNRWIYFHAEFSKPFKAELFVADALQQGKSSVTGKNVKARLNFATKNGEQVLVKVGISPVDCAGAKQNLTAEVPAWDFDGRGEAGGCGLGGTVEPDSGQRRNGRPAENICHCAVSHRHLPQHCPAMWMAVIAAWISRFIRTQVTRTTPCSRCGTPFARNIRSTPSSIPNWIRRGFVRCSASMMKAASCPCGNSPPTTRVA
jgi:hypothetical protein